jgi:hypothetical protein
LVVDQYVKEGVCLRRSKRFRRRHGWRGRR